MIRNLVLLVTGLAISSLSLGAEAPPPQIECPDDAKLMGAPPPKDNKMGCQDKKGNKHGKFITWHKSGKKAVEGTYQRGKEHGSFKSWFKDGQIEKQGNYVNGQFDGEWTRWHKNGKKKDKGEWKNTVPHGDWQFWNDKGILTKEGSFENGKEDGNWSYYYNDGKDKESGKFVAGEKVCTWTSWDEKGVAKDTVYTDEGCGDFLLLAFQGGPIAVVQSAGNSFSTVVTWTPYYEFSFGMGVQGRIGGTVLNKTAGDLFVALIYGANLTYRFSNILLGIGGGAQTWTGGSTNIFADFQAAWLLDNKLLWLIDRFYSGYSVVLLSGATTHQIEAGIGISIF